MQKYQLRTAMLELLMRIEKDQGYSHLLIDKEIQKNRFVQQDAALLTEVVYGTLQRKLTLEYILKQHVDKNKKVEMWVELLLYMSIYQMFYLDKVPDHAIIHEAVEIAKKRGHQGIASFVNGVLRNIQRSGMTDFTNINDPVKKIAIQTSHPIWLVKRWEKQFGLETTQKMCEANLRNRDSSIRIQPLKISRDEAMKKLQAEGFEVEKSIVSNQGIVIKKGNILKSALFKDGYVTIQDQSSMLVGEAVDTKPNMVVLDTCSAPGGKVTHLAEKMRNEGIVKAHDLHKKKIRLVENKAKELSLSIIDASAADARTLGEIYPQQHFDRILVDAPCSGLGVIRSKPDIKYRKKEEDIESLAKIQYDILHRVSSLLKIGGYLVYSTCTVDQSENEMVIKKFLEQHSNYSGDQMFVDSLPEQVIQHASSGNYWIQLFPHSIESDGFFIARLTRTK
ncbi:16S rRNA (cytosine(967)-C(5))-methyltransferase RsmB [Virgibacillus soli]